MPNRSHSYCVKALPFVAGLLLPMAGRAESGVYLAPSFSLGRIYDDNLFSTSTDKQSVSLWRFSPALEAGYQSEPFTIATYYTQDAERYVQDPALDSNAARRHAALELLYLPTQRLDISLNGGYTSTNTADELSPNVGLNLGRTRAWTYSVTPALSYQLSELTTGTAGYSRTRDELQGGPTTNTGTAALGLAHQMSEQSTLRLTYEDTRYDFVGNGSLDSQVMTLGIDYKFGAQTTASFAAGPRDTDGDKVAEVSASLQHRFDSGKLYFSFLRTQTAVIGQAAPVDVRSYEVGMDLTPDPSWEIQLAPTFVSDRIGASRADVYRMNLNASYRFSESISAVGSYQYNRQRGVLGGSSSLEITDNVIFLGLVFQFAGPEGSVFTKRQSSPYETLWPAPRH